MTAKVSPVLKCSSNVNAFKKVLLVDTTGLVFRGNHCLSGSGLEFLKNEINQFIHYLEPTHVCCAIDGRNSNAYRRGILAEYKRTRRPIDTEIVQDLQKLPEFLERSNLASMQCAYFEADDLIHTMCEDIIQDHLHSNPFHKKFKHDDVDHHHYHHPSSVRLRVPKRPKPSSIHNSIHDGFIHNDHSSLSSDESSEMKRNQCEIHVFSVDKDMFPLLSYPEKYQTGDQVSVSIHRRFVGDRIETCSVSGKIQNSAECLDVEPSKVPSYLALVGDKADNIPGCPKIGLKRASLLMDHCKDLNDLLNQLKDPHSLLEDCILSQSSRDRCGLTSSILKGIVEHEEMLLRSLEVIKLQNIKKMIEKSSNEYCVRLRNDKQLSRIPLLSECAL